MSTKMILPLQLKMILPLQLKMTLPLQLKEKIVYNLRRKELKTCFGCSKDYQDIIKARTDLTFKTFYNIYYFYEKRRWDCVSYGARITNIIKIYKNLLEDYKKLYDNVYDRIFDDLYNHRVTSENIMYFATLYGSYEFILRCFDEEQENTSEFIFHYKLRICLEIAAICNLQPIVELLLKQYKIKVIREFALSLDLDCKDVSVSLLADGFLTYNNLKYTNENCKTQESRNILSSICYFLRTMKDLLKAHPNQNLPIFGKEEFIVMLCQVAVVTQEETEQERQNFFI